MGPCIPDHALLPLIAWDLPPAALAEHGRHIDGCSRCAGRVREAMRMAPRLGIVPAPPLEFDDFELLRPLGRGASGRLYLARDVQLGRLVALKFLATGRLGEQARERLAIEARALARMQHPNVVAVYRLGEAGGHRYVAYEYVAGRTLERAGPLPWAEALAIGLQAARGLAAAHRRGVLHRDVKPSNLMRAGDGEVKLVDFGLAKLVEGTGPPGDPSADATLIGIAAAEELGETFAADLSQSAAGSPTRTGQLIGTPLYLAPEAWRGAPPAPPQDVYGLGLVIVELLAGRPPRAGLPLPALCEAVVSAELPPLRDTCPEVPVGLAALIDRCVRRDPAERPSADALAAGLAALAVLSSYAPGREAPALGDADAGIVAASLAAIGSPAALVPGFYARLFAAHPYLRPMFPHDMEGQHAKLAAALHLVVTGLSRPDALRPTLADLGRRHVGYGVTRGHYALVTEALLAALEGALGPAFGPDVRAAWTRALALLVAAMTGEPGEPGEPGELAERSGRGPDPGAPAQ